MSDLKQKLKPPRLSLGYSDSAAQDRFDVWYATHIEPLFAGAVEVYSGSYPSMISRGNSYWTETNGRSQGSRALLIGIEPIKEETAEDILREFIECEGKSAEHLWPVLERAKKWVEKQKQTGSQTDSREELESFRKAASATIDQNNSSNRTVVSQWAVPPPPQVWPDK